MLQAWTARTLCAQLQSVSLQRSRQCYIQPAVRCNSTMVLTTWPLWPKLVFQWLHTQGSQPPQHNTQLALPSAPASSAEMAAMNPQTIHIASDIGMMVATMNEDKDDNKEEQDTQQVSTMKGHETAQIMIESGAATHVCPPWFADNYPIHKLAREQGPPLRTVTNKEIQLHRVKWDYMQCRGQPIVIPFYVWRKWSHPVSNKTGRTMLWHQVQSCPNNDTQQGFQRTTGTEEQPLLPSSNNHTAHKRHATSNTERRQRHNSNDCPNNNDNTRIRTSAWRKKWLLGLQQWRIVGEIPQNNEDVTIYPKSQQLSLSCSPWTTWQFQENIDSKKRRQCRRHYRSVQRFAAQNAKARSQWTTMARIMLAQGDPSRQLDRNNNNGKGITSTGRNQEVRPTSTWETTTINSTTTNGTIQPRPLVQRREFVKKISHCTTHGTLCSTTRRRWTNNHQADKWRERMSIRGWLDKRRKPAMDSTMDRTNELRRRHQLQVRVHWGWCSRDTTGNKSQSNSSTKETNTTRKDGT